MRHFLRHSTFAILPLSIAASAWATPQFARETKMDCRSCHSYVPRLNETGRLYLRNGYRFDGSERATSLPVAVWASGQTQSLPSDSEKFKTIANRVELISAFRSDDGDWTFFGEWRIVSHELASDGSVRDRSGRFEDVQLSFNGKKGIALQMGQFRMLSQIDVSHRLTLSEPLAFAQSMAGEPDPDPRRQLVRGFSPSGRSPGVRVLYQPNDWVFAAALPFPGEFSLPLTDEARTNASFEWEAEPKGVWMEAYRPTESGSVGVHAFSGRNQRRMIGVAAEHSVGRTTVMGGINRAETAGNKEWRVSLGADTLIGDHVAVGARYDHRQIAGQEPILLPFVSLIGFGPNVAQKLVIEGRYQKNQRPRLTVEYGVFF